MTETYTIIDEAESIVANSVSNVFDWIEEDKVSRTQTYIPLLKKDVERTVVNDECPLCGGSLTPMGWFRQSGLREMLYKCIVCGLAVFREV